MKYKLLSQFNVSNKRVFLRTDFNVPIVNKKILDYSKIKAHHTTIDYLTDKGARIILGTHIGRPELHEAGSRKDLIHNNPDTDAIDKLLGQCADSKTPFCLFACSNEPHTPWNKGDASRYPPEKVRLPPYFVDTQQTREDMSRYLAEITYYDSQVGTILDLLEKHGFAKNTLVIVTSEQGSSFPFGKWTCYDTGLQTAFIARWPRKTKPGKSKKARSWRTA